MLKVVIDTNIFISGVLVEKGNPSIIIKAWKRTQKYQLFVTEEIIQEVLKVMKRLDVIGDIIGDWDRTIRKNAISIVPSKEIRAVKNDPSDNKFLECAIEAGADYIVSGDKHLKELKEFKGIKIVSTKEFLDILSKEE
ncbi:MAG: putative toxin-antitoxin system toxin component, PIN family [Candidatus Omnitrophota bacterium]|nr:putative toxin-antitoxin system toxin component, PIN family [Candidatus Omnitrophota bacterium]